jgi:membrane-bound lytic murein transglycosylase D
MNVLSQIKKTINKKSKTYYFFSAGFSVIGIIFVSTNLFFANNQAKKSDYNSNKNFPQDYKIISPYIPDKITVFNENVPLENFEVYERIDREILVNTYWHSSTILAIKRAARWFPVIEPILKENNIPDDFKYLAVVESNLENLVSPAEATGYWQFIKSSATKYGLEVSEQVDERYNIEKSTQAACNYLKDAYEKFGSWAMAAASYNAGVNGIDKWSGLQKAKNYWNLVLGVEPSRYVARVVGVKLVMENPGRYGYDLQPEDLYKPLRYKEVELDSSVADFADYAASLGINYKTLKLYNPWLRNTSLKNKSRKMYKIRVPEEESISLIKE